jgi:hypothetical protein
VANYNGWTNYETWLTNLWFQDVFESFAEEGHEISSEILRDWMESYLQDEIRNQSSFIADCVNNTARAVDWDQIADNYKINAR